MHIDPDAEASVIRRRAKVDPDEPCGMLAIARRLEIDVAFYPQHVLRGFDSLTFKAHGRPQIALRRGLRPKRRTWCIAHEIAEIHLRQTLDYRGEDIEQLADAIAAALLMPRRSFREATREHGPELVALAEDFAVDETAAALRLAEIGAVDAVAVVAPSRIYARAASDSFVMPDEAELRRLARGASSIPGLRKVRLIDEPRRVALLAEDIA